MAKVSKKVRDVRIITEIKAREVHEGKVTKFGNGGAHIIFSGFWKTEHLYMFILTIIIHIIY